MVQTGETFGRTGRYTLGRVSVSHRGCHPGEGLWRSPKQPDKPKPPVKPSPFGTEEFDLARCDAIAVSEATALASARELADCLRSSGDLPRCSRMRESNLRTPIAWTTDGHAHIMSPLCRKSNGRPLLFMEDPHPFHYVDRSTAMKIACTQWSSFQHGASTVQPKHEVPQTSTPPDTMFSISQVFII